jgi:methionine synthase II (cobalamin-independent)
MLALATVDVDKAYLSVVAPGSMAYWLKNASYRNEEEFLYAIVDAIPEDYKAIADAGTCDGGAITPCKSMPSLRDSVDIHLHAQAHSSSIGRSVEFAARA